MLAQKFVRRSNGRTRFARPGIRGDGAMLLIGTLDEPIRFIDHKTIGITRGGV